MGCLPWRSVEAVSGGPRYFHSCHFDGCFRLNLLRRGGYTQDYTQLPYQRYFINNTVVQSLDRAAATTDSTGSTHCSTFHADKVLSAESQKNLITAVGVVVCRHGMLLRLMNFFRGERHLYSTATLWSLFVAGSAVHFWWYDIACRWIKSFGKWLEQEGDPGVVEKGKHVQGIIPPWHRYAHSVTIRQRPQLIKELRERVAAVERLYPDYGPALWQTDTAEFKGALVELAEHEIGQLCTEIEGAVMDYYSLEQVMVSLASRKKERDLAKREKTF
ncbi:hypothetical protein GPECTOR_1477g659 [Gonium pectorale]|uniref:Uncharacterized protein n=1 Tax=Gonium pectorale TaxID=33097 RepID=A0A150FTF8_GONPE|nr:hypothetical protein GPECTOR_1477g659 [Gonium pectorale]|eukprot:KXZ40894.1 hypothetical protein GPECTOR_1477g659 [Gonium pectorale]